MNVVAIILTAAAALLGGGWWLLTERRTELPGTAHVAVAAAVPALLLGVAALAGLAGDEAGDNVVTLASVTAVLAAASCGGIVATALLRLADHAGPGAEHAVDDVDAGASAPIDTRTATVAAVSDPRTLRGGAAIGVLERVAVTVTLLAGWPEGLALVLGMKGLGRYPELNRPPASERFIIGTLGSVLWAIAAAGVVHALRT